MEKPIIATTLSGLFLRHEPWDKAHILWFQDAAEKLGDESVKEWINKSDYFKGVDIIMERLYPRLSDEQRTEKARELFFDSVLKYIEENPKVINKEVIKYFSSLKHDYQLALITTNIGEVIRRILPASGLEEMFDIIETSLPKEKDDKSAVFDRFIKKYGKPIIYIGGGRKDSYDYCKEKNIPRIFANLEGDEDLEDVENVHNLEELKKQIEKLS